ncbi:MAG TPA: 4-hydroxy-tetrahydrodipicolinate synthase [Candidatus Limiplasma sp.]|nr:4-hydroxy-tetrahydrodipicolinate synthase [Candidatus Limiplasma sp.]HRX09639.1 4-hydroxy-tetrahydrodipicolinate synthase [Candidatus Limiplasma sp.]
MAAIFQGSGVALVTPFRNGKVDTDAIVRLVEMQIAAGTAAIIACGTTGEPATMNADECELVVRTCCEVADGRITIIAGTGCNDTLHVIETAKRYENLGCAAQLVVTPYYNKTNREGLYRHFMTVAENTKLPIMIYNVPSRTGIDIQPDLLYQLAQCEQFIGVKESSYDYPTVMEKFAAVKGTQVAMYSGNDDMNYALLTLGGQGTISVAANFIPDKLFSMVNAFMQGDTQSALEQQMALMPINRALFNEVNPIPCKAAMEILGLCSGELRLPLYEIGCACREKLVDALQGLGLV